MHTLFDVSDNCCNKQIRKNEMTDKDERDDEYFSGNNI